MAVVRNIVVVVAAIAFYDRFIRQKTVLNDNILDKYDYVIVGAGSAGGVLSDRLTEDGKHSVLLLEAGVDDRSPIGDQTHIPMNYLLNLKTEADWEYYTVPQEHGCFGLKENRSFWPRGRMLGGSSSINAMYWIRCSRHDYDHWAAHGADGWSYAEVLPYFIRMEDSRAKGVDADYHGYSGPTVVEDVAETPKITEAVLKAVQEIGESVTDVNGKEQIGWSGSQRNVHKGQRQSTAKTYIKRARDRSNLQILTHAHVNKIIFEGKKAVGVEYIHDGRLKKVYVNKEVILSAGAIGSPQILMLSGIGPKDHLEDLKIPVLADLPVGDNLLDHLFVDVPFLVDGQISITPGEVSSLKAKLQYMLSGEGVLSTSGVQGVGFQLSKEQPKDDPRPYLQYLLFSILLGGDAENFDMMGDKMGFDTKMFREFNDGQQNKHGFILLPKLLHPKSVGTIRLQSQNPFDYPLIDPQYLKEEVDLEVLLDGIKHLEKMEKTEGFKSIGARLWDKHHPGCKNHKYRSDDYWRCYIRHNTLTVYHPTTTCKMGSKDDPSTVVDPQLRVHGIEGLRVVDASVMPDITSGNTNAPTIVIAEKASDIILGKQPLRPMKDL